MFSKSKAIAAFAALASVSNAIQLDVRSEASIRDTASTIAHGLMSYYKNNQSTTPAIDVGTFAMPVYWWQAGAVWGGMVDYFAYTGDASYVEATSNALMANIGPAADFLIPEHKGQEGNDDQAFWALSVMSAAENGFPQPANKPLWGDIAKNAFNNIAPRWDTSTCGGGFRWQIYPENNYGYNYKNSISNGGFFQLAARLGRHTGNATYIEWAEKVWDWTVQIGYITPEYHVLDGADDQTGCKRIDHNRWSYNTAIYLYGCASMYAQTGEQKWLDRTNGLLKAAGYYFVQHSNAAPNVMTEVVCDLKNSCNADQSSFRAYLARWMAKTAILVPSTNAQIKVLLEASAKAAANACSGGSGTACGLKWYIGGFDGNTGVGQHLSALEVVQSLLAQKGGYPRKAGDKPAQSPIQSPVIQPSSTSTLVVPPSSTAQAAPSTPPAQTTVAAPVIPTSSPVEAVPVVSQTSTPVAPVDSTTKAVMMPSHTPGSFPEVAPSVCSDVIETVTVTVEPTALFPSSFCTEEIVTVTVTVSPSDTQAVPPVPVVTSSSAVLPVSSSVVVAPTTTPVYPYPTRNATATIGTASSGFLTATSPPIFTGAAVPNAHGSTQLVGFMAAVLGMLAAL